MRKLPWLEAEKYRYNFPGKSPYNSEYGDTYGCFLIPRVNGLLRCIVSDGDYKAAGLNKEFAWEHVSVSLETRCPTWDEMCFIKDLFWDPEECVIQYHPPKSEYKNCHPYTLHLWAPLLMTIPRPPKLAV